MPLCEWCISLSVTNSPMADRLITLITYSPSVCGLETAGNMSSMGKQLRVKSKAWGLWAGREMDDYLHCWRTTKRIRKLPRISRINWQWTNLQAFSWSSTCGPRSVDGSQTTLNGSGICHVTLFFCCSSAPEEEAGASKDDGRRSLSPVTSALHLSENRWFWHGSLQSTKN